MSDVGGPAVYSYTPEVLAGLFVQASARAPGETDNRFVRDKHQLAYLEEYLRTLSCASIVVEPDYVDRDFLEDFSAYHVRSFHPYSRFCMRLHFFSRPLDQAAFERAMLRASEAPPLQNAYLGFMVLRPLPVTVIGRTCLRTYPSKRGVQRLYPTIYRQGVDLYGIPLSVETVAFQEQDRDVAACATSALWSVLQCTGRQFQHAIPSPVAITGTAAAAGGYDERMLPAMAGLTIRQIADALRYVALEPHLVPLEAHAEENGEEAPGEGKDTPNCADAAISRTRLELKVAVAAYLRARIPCLLLLRVAESCGQEPERDVNHAVAVLGYRIGSGGTTPYGESGIHFDASRVDKLFVHDDQVGPFAKMRFEEDGGLTVSWPDGEALSEMNARSHTLVVPLNHKIRIPFGTVLELSLAVARKLETARVRFSQLVGDEPITWDVRLSTLEQFRSDVLGSSLPDEERKRLLTRPMPKYVWRISALIDRVSVLELVLDATDLVQGELLLEVVVYSANAASLFGIVFAAAGNSFDDTPAHRRIRLALSALELPPAVAAAMGGADLNRQIESPSPIQGEPRA